MQPAALFHDADVVSGATERDEWLRARSVRSPFRQRWPNLNGSARLIAKSLYRSRLIVVRGSAAFDEALNDGESVRQHQASRCNDHQNKQGFHNYLQFPKESPEVLHRTVGCVPATRTLGPVFDNSMAEARYLCD